MNFLVMALATLTPKDLRKRFILTFQKGKFNPSNLGGDLMLKKSCDAMKISLSAKTNSNAINEYSQMKGSP